MGRVELTMLLCGSSGFFLVTLMMNPFGMDKQALIIFSVAVGIIGFFVCLLPIYEMMKLEEKEEKEKQGGKKRLPLH